MAASLATSFVPRTASGAPPSDAERPPVEQVDAKFVARQAAREGLALMHQARWAEAQALLARAYKLVPAPTIAVLEGRALEQLGRLVEASHRYEAAAVAPAADAPPAFTEAAADAKGRLDALRPRIPRLSIVLDRTNGDGEAVVLVDGRVLPQEEWSTPVPVDPGEHAVGVRVGTEVLVEDHVLVRTGESKQVVLRLGNGPTNDAKPAPPAPAAVEPGVPASPMKTWGWVSLGVGTAGVATGVVAGAMMLSAKSDLDAACTPICPESASSDLSRFRTTRVVSTVGYGVGIAGLAVGTALLLLAPKTREHSTQTAFVPWFSSSGAVGVERHF